MTIHKPIQRTAQSVALVTLALLSGAGSQGAPAKVSVVFDANWRAAFEPLVTEFNAAHKDVQIDVLWGGDQAKLIAARRAPDIIDTGDLYIEVQRDLLSDLTPWIRSAGTDLNLPDFYPNMISALKLGNQQLALPFRFNIGLLYYNKALFDAAKVKYPTRTWTQNQFVAAAEALTRVDGNRPTQWGATTTLGWWGEWLIHVRQAGGDFMKGQTVTLDTAPAIAGLQFFYDKTSAGRYKFAPGPKDDALGGFVGGKTAMEYGGHTGNWPALNAAKGLNWDIQVLPSGLRQKRGAELALSAYGIYSGTKNPAAAWEVLKYITGRKFITTSFVKLGLPPTRQSVAKEALAVPVARRSNPKNLEALFEGMRSGMTLPRNKDFVNVAVQVVQPEIDRMLEGKVTPAEAARAATEKANKYLSANK